jgi:glyoxylase-like metal-dependent hydrolase (beta-lactamase superfamily II)
VVVGDVELLPVRDAVGVIGTLAELFPETPAAGWERDRERYPELFSGGGWRLPCTCYLVRAAGRAILVDAGVGPPGLWEWQLERGAGLLPGLAALGVGPEDVDLVVLTHLHIDHVGWVADRDGVLVFPRARYALHAEAAECARERADRPHIGRCVLPLLERGLVDVFAGETELAPGVVAVPLPGHDPGHCGLRLGAEAFLVTDAAVHPGQLDEPARRYAFDLDHGTSARTRQALVAEVADTGVLVVCGHYPGTGIGRVVREDGRVTWREAPAAG